MSDINCYIPIKLRITGRPSDSQLDQLGDALVRAITERLAFAERTIGNDRSINAVGASDLRESFLSDHYHPESGTYAIPSYNNNGVPTPVQVQSKSPAPNGGGAAAPITQASGSLTWNEIVALIQRRFPATQGRPDSSGVYYGVYLTMSGTDAPRLYYLVPGPNGLLL